MTHKRNPGIAFVLLSGGIDSTTCLHLATQEYGEVLAISVDYGQRHHKEMEYARKSCEQLGVEHVILPLSKIIPRTMLTDPEESVPHVSYDQIEGVSPTYVPFRNGLMLAALTSHAHGILKNRGYDKKADGIEHALYFGAHSEDAKNWAYPDCTPEFIGAMANAIFIGTYQEIRLITPLQWLTKTKIVELGEDIGVDFENTWSCYKGESKHCGKCPTCLSRIDAFDQAMIEDPTEYQDDEED